MTDIVIPRGTVNQNWFGSLSEGTGAGLFFQTFTAPGGSLTSVSFSADIYGIPNGATIKVYIAEVVGGQIGSILYTSSLVTIPYTPGEPLGYGGASPSGGPFNSFIVNTGGVALVAGATYVLLFDDVPDGDGATALSLGWNYGEGAYAGGYFGYHFANGSSFEGITLSGDGWNSDLALTLTFGPSNQAPAANDDSATTDEDSAVTVLALANDADPDGDDLSISVAAITNGALGSVSIAGDSDSFSYDPGSAYNYLAFGESATVEIGYTISDGNGETDSATATITVTGVNDGPTANDDDDGAVEDGAPATGNVLGNDTDPDTSDTLSVTQVNGSAASVGAATQGTYGTLTLESDGSYSYSADADLLDTLSGAGPYVETFSYETSDGQGGTDTATLTIAVTLANDSYTIDGTNQPDTISGDQNGAGNEDTIWGGNSGDTLSGLAGADVLHGENGNDNLSGGSGRDALYGGNGVDALDGGLGDDVLAGGNGNDVLTGGGGDDRFVFGQGGGNDTVTDFGAGDTIMLLDGISVKKSTIADLDGDGDLDLMLQLTNGSVTLLDVNAPLGADAFVI